MIAEPRRGRALRLALLVALCLAAAEAGAEGEAEKRQRVDSGRAAGIEARLGAEASIRPGAEWLELGAALSLGLSRGSLSARARLPFSAALGPEGSAAALGDLESGIEAASSLGGWRLAFGIQALAPTGRSLPALRGPGAGSPSWRIAASLEAARALDPAMAAARLEAGLVLPRRGLAPAPYPELGIGLSFAEALNARVSIALSASLGAAFPKARAGLAPGFSGGAGIAIAWGGGALSYRAGLSGGLGEAAEAGPALELGASYLVKKE